MLRRIYCSPVSAFCIFSTLLALLYGNAAAAQETGLLSDKQPAATEVRRPAVTPGTSNSGEAGDIPAIKAGARISSRLTTRVPSRLQTRLGGSRAPSSPADAASQIRAADEEQKRRR